MYILFCILLTALLGCEQNKIVKKDPIAQPVPPQGPINRPEPPPLPPAFNFVSFDQFEAEILADLTDLPSNEQRTARYITVCDQWNAGENISNFKLGVVKAINQISIENDLAKGIWIGEQKCTLRIDLEDYGLTLAHWRLVEDADPLKLESFTDRGLLIKQLAETNRPWMHGANFIETSHTDETYYDVLRIPADLSGFLAGFAGCDLQADFDNFEQDLFLIGARKSLIALQKNREILLTDCKDGAFSATYDFVLGNNDDGANLSINPFPPEARSERTFEHQAQEYIGKLPNGMLFYALFNSAGVRENFAPTNIVADNVRANIDPTIRNARSCSACHAHGFIEADDFVADHVLGNPEFDIEDIQKAAFFFGREEGARTAIDQSNEAYSRVLAQLGIDSEAKDPLNLLTDQIRFEMDLRQIAALFFMEEEEFALALLSSPQGRLAIGQLLNGDTISFQDLVIITPVLIRDLNLFQEDLGK